MTDERSKECREGAAAFKAGIPRSANPYPCIQNVSAVCWAEWLDGWLETESAVRRTDDGRPHDEVLSGETRGAGDGGL